jgi:DNA-binding NarL/FixJ family response regulator
MSKVRVLVVDDHAIVRHTVCSLLTREPAVNVICQTASGEEAIKKAQELQPDLILLDIGLPGISGIDAAREIRVVSPDCKILFLSQHDSVEMAREAFKVGGHGYVVKIDAAAELLSAVREVCSGRQFASKRLSDQGWKMDSL